jgi:hypothetical protein
MATTEYNTIDIVKQGLDFILTHFQAPIWPRTISTSATSGAQVLVYSKEEANAHFEAAGFTDCRINAYPSFTEYKGINRQPPNFIFIDLDRCSFNTEKALDLAINRTLKNIRWLEETAEPTVIWTGNGYHIYQPIDAFVLEQEEVFARFDQPSKKFLRFVARYLSNYKSDPNNNPSLRSCMLRIPGSLNSKCVNSCQVQLIKRWNGFRPKMCSLVGSFHAWIMDQQIRDYEAQNNSIRRHFHNGYECRKDIQWIEQLLQHGIPDCRKFAIWRILAPYLINVKKLSYVEAFDIIRKWLGMCNELQKLSFYPNAKIEEGLRGAIKGYLPISFSNLAQNNADLYDLLRGRVV